jgi:uncharacterized membrane protein
MKCFLIRKIKGGKDMIAFWFFMLFPVLMISVLMIAFGKSFTDNPPQKINNAYGYRTSMSMKNEDTWQFAHEYCGKLWNKAGKIMLPASVVLMLPAAGRDLHTVGVWSSVILIAEVVVMLATIPFVEHALRKNFDSDGRRR